MDSPEPDSPAKRRWLPSPAALTGVVLVGLVLYGLTQGTGTNSAAQQTERDRVAACWSDSGLKAGSADDQRAKTSECERLESGFRKKYGGSP